MNSLFVAVKTRVKPSRERKSPEKEDVTVAEGCFWYVKPEIRIDAKTNRRTFYGMNQKEIQRLRELVKSNFFVPDMLCTIANMNEESGSKKQTRLRSLTYRPLYKLSTLTFHTHLSFTVVIVYFLTRSAAGLMFILKPMARIVILRLANCAF